MHFLVTSVIVANQQVEVLVAIVIGDVNLCAFAKSIEVRARSLAKDVVRDYLLRLLEDGGTFRADVT